MIVRQTHVVATVAKRELMMVDAHQIQDRCPHLAHRTPVFHGVVTIVVCEAVGMNVEQHMVISRPLPSATLRRTLPIRVLVRIRGTAH